MEQNLRPPSDGPTGKLYIVGTPIGNLDDISYRAVSVLSSVDRIAAEDTRVTAKLLNRFNIKTPLTPYHEHNKKEAGRQIVRRLLTGEKVALVTDAGMPSISDPGEDLVDLCHRENIPVESVPGPSALVTALSLSGMSAGRFCFEGFLSVSKTSRQKHLESLKDEERTVIFYEAPHKLVKTLDDMLRVFGDRDIALVKEMTKIHECVIRAKLSAAVKMFEGTEPKGEFVLIVAGKSREKRGTVPLDEAAETAARLMAEGQSASAAAKRASEKTGQRKTDIYRKLQKK